MPPTNCFDCIEELSRAASKARLTYRRKKTIKNRDSWFVLGPKTSKRPASTKWSSGAQPDEPGPLLHQQSKYPPACILLFTQFVYIERKLFKLWLVNAWQYWMIDLIWHALQKKGTKGPILYLKAVQIKSGHVDWHQYQNGNHFPHLKCQSSGWA